MKTSTQVDYNKEIKLYFKEIDKFKPLSKKDEKKIGIRIKKGDSTARNELISSNLKFVVNVAKAYKGYGVPFTDLISEGNLGLIRAAEKYDYNKDVKFISYSVWWIRQAIQEYLKKNKLIDDIETSNDEHNYENYTVDEEGNEIINNVQYSCDEYNPELEESRKKIIAQLLSCLSERERVIMSNYYGLDDTDVLTLEEIGNKYNLTKERVRQIKEKALRKIRSNVLLHPDFAKIQSMQ